MTDNSSHGHWKTLKDLVIDMKNARPHASMQSQDSLEI
jgi:hypothetical protein